MDPLLSIENCIVKKTGKSWTVWFAPSQSFVLLEEPAYEVFRRMQEGQNDHAIVKSIKKIGGIPEKEAQDFIAEIRSNNSFLMDPENRPYNTPTVPEAIHRAAFKDFETKFYRIQNLLFRVSFSSPVMKMQLHPLLSHLAVEGVEVPDFSLELISWGEFLVFRENGTVVEYFRKEHMHYLKGAVLKKIAGLLYSINETDWMATLHASAVSDGKTAILFSARPGGGKSTFAALLQANGFTLLADDFIAIDQFKSHVWPTPLASSVKEGSLAALTPWYPQLANLVPETSPTGKKGVYLPPRPSGNSFAQSFPVKAIVFIQYSPDIGLQLETPETEEALQTLLSETWVNPTKKNVESFLDWAVNMKFYRLWYSDFKAALKEITRIFES